VSPDGSLKSPKSLEVVVKIALNVDVVVLYPLPLTQALAFFCDEYILLAGILLKQIIIKALLNSSQKLL
jgi:hypothetical protein